MPTAVKNAERTTEDLLRVLHSITYWAHLTNLTAEMCYEVMEYTAEGTNYSWIAYDEWNFFKLRQIDCDNWSSIKNKLRDNVLDASDIEGTDLERLVDYIKNQDGRNAHNLPVLLAELAELPERISGPLYCYYDTVCHFALSEEEVKIIAGESVCVSTMWEDLTLNELADYVELYEDDGPLIPLVFFED